MNKTPPNIIKNNPDSTKHVMTFPDAFLIKANATGHKIKPENIHMAAKKCFISTY